MSHPSVEGATPQFDQTTEGAILHAAQTGENKDRSSFSPVWAAGVSSAWLNFESLAQRYKVVNKGRDLDSV
jgi:hypothetical protein